MSNFTHLHVHTAYSLLDGAIRLDDLLVRAKDYNMNSVAMTDHGQMFGAHSFYKKAQKAGIKPIIGCEMYLAVKGRHLRNPRDPRYHLILLAKDYQGYQNLIKLVTKANVEGFYYKPRIDLEILEKYSEGLIALSACLSGEIPKLIVSGREEEALKAAQRYSRMFEGRFYLELQENFINEQKIANDGLIRIASELKLPLVATNDCHYLDKENAEAHDVLLCVQTGAKVNDENRMRFQNQEFYFKNGQEMADLFPDCPEAISNTVKIADEINLEMPESKYHFPVFPLPEGENLDSQVTKESESGLQERLTEIRKTREVSEEEEKVYHERLAMELGIITKMGFSGYFLIVSDFIKYALGEGIPVGPGRGSGAGSLVAYSLRITDLDPLHYGLLFERFLNPERISMPDFDIDFCKNGREKVIQYVSQKYGGSDYVAQIITFGQMQARAVIRDVGRALDVPYSDVDRIAKLVPNKLGINLTEALEMEPRLTEARNQDQRIDKLLTIALMLEGLPRHASTHAAGLVIGDKPLVEYLPLYCVSGNDSKDGEKVVVTQFDMHGVEDLGLVKFDFLGLKTLTLIDYCLKLLKERGVNIDLSMIDLKDKETFKLLCAGDTTGVFQLESSGNRDLLRRAQPDRFEDLTTLVALYRPGPIESGMLDIYVGNKRDESKITYELPELEPVLKDTYGAIIYQEQVMEIANRLANYSLGEADILRKAMGKKNEKVMAEQKIRFMAGIKENGLDPKKSEKVFEHMAKFSGYGFNKAHTAAYGLIAYQTAFLKTHYPHEFMAALLNNEVSNTDKIVFLMAECASTGLNVNPPDINKSGIDFIVRDENIIFGLAAIKGLGRAAIEAMVEARKDGEFNDLFDLCRKVDLRRVNRKVIEALIKSGALDSTGAGRAEMAAAIDDALDMGNRVQRDRESGQTNLFANIEADGEEPPVNWPKVKEWSESQRLTFEKESLGFYISGHPLDKYEDDLEALTTTDLAGLTKKSNKVKVRVGGLPLKVNRINTKKGLPMAFLMLEDKSGQAEIVVFPEVYKTAFEHLESEEVLLVSGEVSVDDKGPNSERKILANEIIPISQAINGKAESIIFILEGDVEDNEKLLKLKSLINHHQGQTSLQIRLNIPGQGAAILGVKEKVEASPEMIEAARELLGRKGVKVHLSF